MLDFVFLVFFFLSPNLDLLLSVDPHLLMFDVETQVVVNAHVLVCDPDE